ncbi:MAG: zf-HC2 domain-containing protein [Clostridia bacterium]|nr:zf-HC2 domain-containing protein [Clostridia bacterium]
MDCNIVKDLIPLYIDGCCSSESAKTVEDHISKCQECRELLEIMKTPANIEEETIPNKFGRINLWKASVLQSVLLFVAFGLIAIGVAMEARTPLGLLNGYWAFNLVVPATGLLLSLTTWYFVRLFRNKKRFSDACSLITLAIIICAWIWAMMHYEASFINEPEILFASILLNSMGIALTVIFCFLSKVLSNKYAKLLGKE